MSRVTPDDIREFFCGDSALRRNSSHSPVGRLSKVRSRSFHVNPVLEPSSPPKSPKSDDEPITILEKKVYNMMATFAELRRPWMASSLFDGSDLNAWRFAPGAVSGLLLGLYIGVHGRFGREQYVLNYPRWGDPFSECGWHVPIIATILYLGCIHFGILLMDRKETPVRNRLREFMIAYNGYQCLLSIYMFVTVIKLAYEAGFQLWGNAYDPSRQIERKLGCMIWMHYFNHTIELIDMLFIILRKRWEEVTNYKIYSQLILLWGWFFVAKYHCGGDAYFPVVCEQIVRCCTYTFYLGSLCNISFPGWWKKFLTALQLSQYGACMAHAMYVIVFFKLSRAAFWLCLLEMAVMFGLLVVFSNFHASVEDGRRESLRDTLSKKKRFVLSFDSSAWMFVYHFGIAHYLQKHILPNVNNDRIAYSGVSGGCLVAGTLCCKINQLEMTKTVIKGRPLCMPRFWNMLPYVEHCAELHTPAEGAALCSGRLRVMLTRVGFSNNIIPFKAEVCSHFRNRDHLIQVMRASCHVPFVGGVLPYNTGDGRYYDGFCWNNAWVVPWRSFRSDDLLCKVSAIGLPNVDIKPCFFVPPWWTIFPPKEDVLWGVFAQGYYDACQFFEQADLPWELPTVDDERTFDLPEWADRHRAISEANRSWRAMGSIIFMGMAHVLHSYVPFASVGLMCWNTFSASRYDLLLLPLSVYLWYMQFYGYYDMNSFAEMQAWDVLYKLWPVLLFMAVRREFYVLGVIFFMVLSDWADLSRIHVPGLTEVTSLLSVKNQMLLKNFINSPILKELPDFDLSRYGPFMARFASFGILLVGRITHSFIYYYQ